MNYIGSKNKLSEFLITTIKNVVGKNLQQKTFCDLFAGTGIVSRNLKTEVEKIICNDIEFYSYVLLKNYIGNGNFKTIDFEKIDYLNNLKPIEGFIFKNYCINPKSERQYFSTTNGKKIDTIRTEIENLKTAKKINLETYYFLLASLLESADKVANTASVYGAYLKHLKKSAQNNLVLKAANFIESKKQNLIFNEDANQLIKNIEGDILYLDPPYNARQYGANYHLLNTIALYDNFEPKGKTGLRFYKKSKYCSKQNVKIVFEDLIKNAKFNYIFLSYNNEGLMTTNEVKQIFEKYGKYDLVTKKYQRFKADKTENRNHKANSTLEYLHILQKN